MSEGPAGRTKAKPPVTKSQRLPLELQRGPAVYWPRCTSRGFGWAVSEATQASRGYRKEFGNSRAAEESGEEFIFLVRPAPEGVSTQALRPLVGGVRARCQPHWPVESGVERGADWAHDVGGVEVGAERGVGKVEAGSLLAVPNCQVLKLRTWQNQVPQLGDLM